MRDRFFPACGVTSVVLVLAGSVVAAAEGQLARNRRAARHRAPEHELGAVPHELGLRRVLPARGRRWLGWSAIGLAVLTLVATHALVEHGGQVGYSSG